MAEAGLLAGLELVVRLVLVLVHILQEVRLQGRREWMRKIGVDHNSIGLPIRLLAGDDPVLDLNCLVWQRNRNWCTG